MDYSEESILNVAMRCIRKLMPTRLLSAGLICERRMVVKANLVWRTRFATPAVTELIQRVRARETTKVEGNVLLLPPNNERRSNTSSHIKGPATPWWHHSLAA